MVILQKKHISLRESIRMSQKYLFIVLATAVALSIPYGIYRYSQIQKQTTDANQPHNNHNPLTQNLSAVEGLTVFIHGTTGSSLNFCDPIHCFTQSASLEEREQKNHKNRAEKIVESYRNHPAMRYDQMLDTEGLVIWDQEKASEQEAATYLIPAYQSLEKLAGIRAQHETYALFGWSGLLSQKARKDSGFELYKALINYQKEQRLNGKKDARIRLITHSHGGNVALWLAEAEAIYQEGLTIETLVMLGAPIQEETAQYIASPVFSSIFLGYSTGDSVQRSDCISTQKRKSFARMQDLVDIESLKTTHPELQRYDILLGMNNNAAQVTHINMWMSGRSLKLAPVFGPLPLVIIIPQIIRASYCTQLPTQSKLSIDAYKGSVVLEFFENPYQKHLPHTIEWKPEEKIFRHGPHPEKLYKKIAYWGTRMNEEWRKYDKSRNIFWNKKNLDILKSALW